MILFEQTTAAKLKEGDRVLVDSASALTRNVLRADRVDGEGVRVKFEGDCRIADYMMMYHPEDPVFIKLGPSRQEEVREVSLWLGPEEPTKMTPVEVSLISCPRCRERVPPAFRCIRCGADLHQ